MKKGTVIATSVFDFVLSVGLIISSLPFFAAFWEIAKVFFGDGFAVFILLFFIFIVLLAVAAIPLLAGLVCLGFAATNLAAGIKKLTGLKNGNPKTVRRFSLVALIINTCVAVFSQWLAIDVLMHINADFGLPAVAVLVTAVISTADAILNAVCYGEAKQLK